MARVQPAVMRELPVHPTASPSLGSPGAGERLLRTCAVRPRASIPDDLRLANSDLVAVGAARLALLIRGHRTEAAPNHPYVEAGRIGRALQPPTVGDHLQREILSSTRQRIRGRDGPESEHGGLAGVLIADAIAVHLDQPEVEQAEVRGNPRCKLGLAFDDAAERRVELLQSGWPASVACLRGASWKPRLAPPGTGCRRRSAARPDATPSLPSPSRWYPGREPAPLRRRALRSPRAPPSVDKEWFRLLVSRREPCGPRS